MGAEASEAYLKGADLGRFRLLHLAAHAVLDEAEPDRSAIRLAPGGPGEDGLLQPREVIDLNLDGAVILLSACRTAGGPILAGEGVMSLARSFFQARAPTVVGSLWPLRDRDSAALMEAFYRPLAQGLPVGTALAAAKRDRIRAGAPAAAWAGVVVLGSGARAPWPERVTTPGRLGTVLLVAVLAALAAMLVLRRRRRA
jgi:CHAT domain-containing protein